MKNLLISEQLLVVLKKENGKFLVDKSSMYLALVTAGLFDLVEAGIVTINNKMIDFKTEELPETLQCLTPLVETIKELKKKSLSKLTDKYSSSMTAKRERALFASVEESLLAKGGFVEGTKTFFGKEETITVPAPAMQKDLRDAMGEALHAAEPDSNIMIVMALLNGLKKLSYYLSNYEIKTAKETIKAFRDNPANQTLKYMLDQNDAAIAAIMVTTIM